MAKNGSQLATGGEEGGWWVRGRGGVGGERNTEQGVTHICYRRKTRGLRKSSTYESKFLPIPVASVRFQFKIQGLQPQAEFLDVTRNKSLRVFLLAIHSHLY